MTSIVIPACDIRANNREDLDELLSCIESDKYKAVVVCFDGCEIDFVEYFTAKYPFIHSLHNKGNPLGFTNNSNAGLRFIRDVVRDGCFLINQDCIVPSYQEMMKVVGAGLTTPMTTGTLPLPVGGNTIRMELKNKFPFYCPYFSYNLLKDVGLLDSDLKVLFSDDSYVLKTLLHGKYPVESVNVYIHHKGSHIDTKEGWESKSGSYRSSDLGLGLLQYQLKWGAQGVPHNDIIPTVLKNLKWSEEMRFG